MAATSQLVRDLVDKSGNSDAVAWSDKRSDKLGLRYIESPFLPIPKPSGTAIVGVVKF